jgi:hypothetical protein
LCTQSEVRKIRFQGSRREDDRSFRHYGMIGQPHQFAGVAEMKVDPVKTRVNQPFGDMEEIVVVGMNNMISNRIGLGRLHITPPPIDDGRSWCVVESSAICRLFPYFH